MAFNLATFKTRTLSAAIFVVVMLTGLLWNQWSFFILFSIIHFGCWMEYQRLVGLIDPEYVQITPFHKYGVILAGWWMMFYFTNGSFSVFGIRLEAIGLWMGLIFVFVLPIAELLFARELVLKNIGYSVLGLLYISLSWGFMMDLRSTEIIPWQDGIPKWVDWYAKIIPCGLILSIWINDTIAYIVGSLIGRTPFSKVSPKKTWEGTVGGAILCVVVIALLGYRLHFYKVVDWIIIASIATISGTAGDLLESKIKRMAGVKDSGQLMPGHGGFLDRFDSLLLATPCVWFYVIFFMR